MVCVGWLAVQRVRCALVLVAFSLACFCFDFRLFALFARPSPRPRCLVRVHAVYKSCSECSRRSGSRCGLCYEEECCFIRLCAVNECRACCMLKQVARFSSRYRMFRKYECGVCGEATEMLVL